MRGVWFVLHVLSLGKVVSAGLSLQESQEIEPCLKNNMAKQRRRNERRSSSPNVRQYQPLSKRDYMYMNSTEVTEMTTNRERERE